jgi:hypothetical protein
LYSDRNRHSHVQKLPVVLAKKLPRHPRLFMTGTGSIGMTASGFAVGWPLPLTFLDIP